MNFSDFLYEAKALSLSPNELKTVTNIALTYIDHYQTTSKEFLKKNSTLLPRSTFPSIYLDKNDKKLKPRYIHIGTYTVTERKTKEEKNVDVFLIIDAPTTKNNGVYKGSTEEIFLFHDLLTNTTKQGVINTVSHEIIHAVQHYRTVSDTYGTDSDDEAASRRNYYLEPIEIEAFLGGTISSLYTTFLEYLNTIKKYNKLHDKSLVRYYIGKATQFIENILTFINSSPDMYQRFSSNEIPSVILSRINFFKTLSEDKRLKRKYQTDLLKAVERMKMDLNFVKKG